MLIAEIGNNHNGSIKKFRQMISESKSCGADLVKGQAFVYSDIKGSMPSGFYRKCQFNMWDLLELIDFAKTYYKIDLFFSIFSDEYLLLKDAQKWHKIAAGQLGNFDFNDNDNTIVSISCSKKILPILHHAKILHVTDYLTREPHLERIDELSKVYNRQVGLSDHTIGVDTAIKAIKKYNCNIIEKHFVLKEDKNNIKYDGVTFRDSIHAATPKEMEKISNAMRNM